MMFPTYKSLLTSIDDFDKRVDILMVPIENVKGYKNDKFRNYSLIFIYSLDRDNTTKPKFVFFQEGKVVDEVNGADIPNVVDKIIKYLPMVY